MHCFPIVGRDHFNRIPGTSIEEGAVWPLTCTLLTSDTEIRVDFDAAEGWMIFVGHPKHAGFNRTILDARRRARASGAAIGGDGQYARTLFARGFTIPNRHRPMLVYNIEHFVESLPFPVRYSD